MKQNNIQSVQKIYHVSSGWIDLAKSTPKFFDFRLGLYYAISKTRNHTSGIIPEISRHFDFRSDFIVRLDQKEKLVAKYSNGFFSFSIFLIVTSST